LHLLYISCKEAVAASTRALVLPNTKQVLLGSVDTPRAAHSFIHVCFLFLQKGCGSGHLGADEPSSDHPLSLLQQQRQQDATGGGSGSSSSSNVSLGRSTYNQPHAYYLFCC
jgi:hypothetical protein